MVKRRIEITDRVKTVVWPRKGIKKGYIRVELEVDLLNKIAKLCAGSNKLSNLKLTFDEKVKEE